MLGGGLELVLARRRGSFAVPSPIPKGALRETIEIAFVVSLLARAYPLGTFRVFPASFSMLICLRSAGAIGVCF